MVIVCRVCGRQNNLDTDEKKVSGGIAPPNERIRSYVFRSQGVLDVPYRSAHEVPISPNRSFILMPELFRIGVPIVSVIWKSPSLQTEAPS